MGCFTPSLFFLIILFFIPNSKSAPTYLYSFCSNNTMFTPQSAYQSNLNRVFTSLSSNATNPSGFSMASFPANTTTEEAVHGLFLCRGDQNYSACHDCATRATTELPNKYCPDRKVAVIWYDECMIRYSNESFFGVMAQSPAVLLINTQNFNGNQTQFSDLLGNMMNDVAKDASDSDGSGKKFATEVKGLNSLVTIYALGQCTPDLSPYDCNRCLRNAIERLDIKQGARVLQPSCNVRYETYPFFNGADNLSSTPPPPVLPATDPPGSTPLIRSPVGRQKKKVSATVIIAIVLPITAVSMILFSIGLCLIRKCGRNYNANAIETEEELTDAESLQYDFGTLESATNYFSLDNKLGEGGFGEVYKGILPNGREIAVKRLSKWSGQGIQEFKNEVLLIAKLQHRNLVRVLGFCFTREEKALVYEYVPNKSLDHFLFDPEKRVQLNWGQRYKIIQGIARGMLYLHQDSQLKIIHRDLKASNILLDMDMNPKISDFGMAKIFTVEQHEGTTSRVVGTYGYMSPEYAMHGQYSIKSDVYSFGIVVLEIISGKKITSFHESGYAEDLLSYAWMQWRDGNPLEFMDPTIRDSCSNEEVTRCMHIGLLCAQESIEKRPTMATILLTLDSKSVTLSVPEQPTLFGKTLKFQKEISGESSNKSTPWSVNEVSITEFDPR